MDRLDLEAAASLLRLARRDATKDTAERWDPAIAAPSPALTPISSPFRCPIARSNTTFSTSATWVSCKPRKAAGVMRLFSWPPSPAASLIDGSDSSATAAKVGRTVGGHDPSTICFAGSRLSDTSSRQRSTSISVAETLAASSAFHSMAADPTFVPCSECAIARAAPSAPDGVPKRDSIGRHGSPVKRAPRLSPVACMWHGTRMAACSSSSNSPRHRSSKPLGTDSVLRLPSGPALVTCTRGTSGELGCVVAAENSTMVWNAANRHGPRPW
jgi:hypothetical protein